MNSRQKNNNHFVILADSISGHIKLP